jgi:ParB-like chromosome segregation protein Spo0J
LSKTTETKYPTVDPTSHGARYILVDLKDIEFKSPGDTDILQSREFYGTEAEISSMMESIKTKGLLDPLEAIENDSGEGYRATEGNRRGYCLNKLVESGVYVSDNGKPLTKVRVVVKSSIHSIVESTVGDWLSLNPDATEEALVECRTHVRDQVTLDLGQNALIRNTQRMNWSPIEQARQIQLQLDGGETIDNMAKAFGLAVQTVRTRLSLLEKETEMPEVIEAVDKNEVSFSVGKLLANVSDEMTRKEVLETAKGDAESKPSAVDIKEIIDTKHQESKDAGGEGVKVQDRKKKSIQKAAVRSPESLLETINALASTRAVLAKDTENPVAVNAEADLTAAIIVLQWVLDPKDVNTLEVLLLGAS